MRILFYSHFLRCVWSKVIYFLSPDIKQFFHCICGSVALHYWTAPDVLQLSLFHCILFSNKYCYISPNDAPDNAEQRTGNTHWFGHNCFLFIKKRKEENYLCFCVLYDFFSLFCSQRFKKFSFSWNSYAEIYFSFDKLQHKYNMKGKQII